MAPEKPWREYAPSRAQQVSNSLGRYWNNDVPKPLDDAAPETGRTPALIHGSLFGVFPTGVFLVEELPITPHSE